MLAKGGLGRCAESHVMNEIRYGLYLGHRIFTVDSYLDGPNKGSPKGTGDVIQVC